MIKWKNELKIGPPYIASLSDHPINDISESSFLVHTYPQRIQTVERRIKVTIEARTEVTEYKARYGYISQSLLSRKISRTFLRFSGWRASYYRVWDLTSTKGRWPERYNCGIKLYFLRIVPEIASVLVSLREQIFNNCMKQVFISQRFNRGVIKLLCKKNNGGMGTTTLNT